MEKIIIQVKEEENKWGVDLRDSNGNNAGAIKMQSKEDAIRYARICEQRTGSEILLPNQS